jgi:hypothetical protein
VDERRRATVPLQRPPELGDRRTLTDEEFAARKQRDDETRGDVKVAAGTFVGEVGTRSLRQTSLVVSPANGRVPARTPAADQRMAALAKGVNPLLPRSWDDRSLFERCISRGPLAALPTLYGNGLRIVQSPNDVVISHEMIHEARVIPLDVRARVSGALKSYMGYSTGRWEGDCAGDRDVRLHRSHGDCRHAAQREAEGGRTLHARERRYGLLRGYRVRF